MLSSNMDFNFAYFPHFDLAHFEIEESFELVWVKLQNDRVASFHFAYLKGVCFKHRLYF